MPVSKSAPAGSNNSNHHGYFIVGGDRVVFRSSSLGEANAFRLGRKTGLVCAVIGGSEAIEPCETENEPPPPLISPPAVPNPVAKAIKAASDEVLDGIWDAVEGEIDISSPCGTVDVFEVSIYDRTATNEECAFAVARLGGDTKIDLRRRVPPQVANWLRGEAAKLLAMADQVEAVEDRRNLAAIRRLAATPDDLVAVA